MTLTHIDLYRQFLSEYLKWIENWETANTLDIYESNKSRNMAFNRDNYTYLTSIKDKYKLDDSDIEFLTQN